MDSDGTEMVHITALKHTESKQSVVMCSKDSNPVERSFSKTSVIFQVTATVPAKYDAYLVGYI